MPLVKIELAKGNSKEFLKTMLQTVMNTVVEILQLPDDDRNIRLMEYDSELFTMKPPYKYIINIDMFEGRSEETKRKLYKSLAANLQENLNIDPSHLFVLVNAQPKINWGVRGGIPASDIKLDFKVDL